MNKKINFCITGAAGSIAYALLSMLFNTKIFQESTSIHLRLVDLKPMMKKLEALKLQLEDCCYTDIQEIIITDSLQEGFDDADIVIFLGGMSRKPGMERSEVIEKNAEIFQQQGRVLNLYAKKSCKSLVVANPCNTNCLVLAMNAPSIPNENFTCLMRMDYNRFVSEISKEYNCSVDNVKNVIIWGNHSMNQFCDFRMMQISTMSPEQLQRKSQQLDRQQLNQKINQKHRFLMDNSVGSVSMSAAKAIIDHLKDWLHGSDRIVTMGVVIKSSVYEIPEEICFSIPCVCSGNGRYKHVEQIQLNEEQKKRIQACKNELIREKNIVQSYLKPIQNPE